MQLKTVETVYGQQMGIWNLILGFKGFLYSVFLSKGGSVNVGRYRDPPHIHEWPTNKSHQKGYPAQETWMNKYTQKQF